MYYHDYSLSIGWGYNNMLYPLFNYNFSGSG